jgi:hypothetical protein
MPLIALTMFIKRFGLSVEPPPTAGVSGAAGVSKKIIDLLILRFLKNILSLHTWQGCVWRGGSFRNCWCF